MEKILTKCPTCLHAMWEGSVCNHLRNEPVIVSTGRYRLIEHNYRGSKELYTCKVCNKYYLQYAYRNQSTCSLACGIKYRDTKIGERGNSLSPVFVEEQEKLKSNVV